MVLDRINNILLSNHRFLSKQIEDKNLFLEVLNLKLKDNFQLSIPRIKVKDEFIKITFFGPLAPIRFDGKFVEDKGLELKGSFKISTITITLALSFYLLLITVLVMGLIGLMDIVSYRGIVILLLIAGVFFLWDIFKWRRRVRRLKLIILN
jgi:hypothetical protein